MTDRLPLLLARLRLPLLFAGMLLSLSGRFHDAGWTGAAGFVLIVAGLALIFVPAGAVRRAAVPVRPPVGGRWVAVNSPANRVPSHGTHEFGQSYAIDMVYHPDPHTSWKGVHAWPPARPARAFPGFGRPVLAPADGVVVKAAGWQRDHWSRNSWPGLIYLMTVEGLARGVLAPFLPSALLGNHVVLDLGDGVYAALAHLRRGSVRVRPGRRVRAGEQIGECGNSGNSSEPHLHFQLMDRRNAALAAGLPFSFDYESAGAPAHGVPRNQEAFTTAPGGV